MKCGPPESPWQVLDVPVPSTIRLKLKSSRVVLAWRLIGLVMSLGPVMPKPTMRMASPRCVLVSDIRLIGMGVTGGSASRRSRARSFPAPRSDGFHDGWYCLTVTSNSPRYVGSLEPYGL